MMCLLTGGTTSLGPGPPRRITRIGIGVPTPTITVRLPLRKIITNVHRSLRIIIMNIIPTTDRKCDNGYRRSTFQNPLKHITIIIIITTDDRNRNYGYRYVKSIVWISSGVHIYKPSVTCFKLFALPSDMLMNWTHHSDDDLSMYCDNRIKAAIATNNNIFVSSTNVILIEDDGQRQLHGDPDYSDRDRMNDRAISDNDKIDNKIIREREISDAYHRNKRPWQLYQYHSNCYQKPWIVCPFAYCHRQKRLPVGHSSYRHNIILDAFHNAVADDDIEYFVLNMT